MLARLVSFNPSLVGMLSQLVEYLLRSKLCFVPSWNSGMSELLPASSGQHSGTNLAFVMWSQRRHSVRFRIEDAPTRTETTFLTLFTCPLSHNAAGRWARKHPDPPAAANNWRRWEGLRGKVTRRVCLPKTHICLDLKVRHSRSRSPPVFDFSRRSSLLWKQHAPPTLTDHATRPPPRPPSARSPQLIIIRVGGSCASAWRDLVRREEEPLVILPHERDLDFVPLRGLAPFQTKNTSDLLTGVCFDHTQAGPTVMTLVFNNNRRHHPILNRKNKTTFPSNGRQG